MDQASWDKWIASNKDIHLKEEFILMGKALEYEKGGMCSGAGSGKIAFDPYPIVLADEIEKRAKDKEYFEENDLWFLAYCLITAQHEYFTKTGNKLGDVRPANILVSDQGQIKVPCLLSWPNYQSNYSKTLNGKDVTYLAPEQLQLLGKGVLQDNQAIHSEVFSLGLTLLSASQLTDYSPLYKLKQSCLDDSKFDKAIEDWKKNNQYSELFRAVVLNMCERDVKFRITSGELWAWITTYEKEIEKKEKFNVKEINPKIQKSLEEIKGKKVKSLYSPLPPAIDTQKLSQAARFTFTPPVNLPISHPTPTVLQHQSPTITQQSFFKPQSPPLQYQPKLEPFKRPSGSVNIKFVNSPTNSKTPLQFIGNTNLQHSPPPLLFKNVKNMPLQAIHQQNNQNKQSVYGSSPHETDTIKSSVSVRRSNQSISVPEVVVVPPPQTTDSATKTPYFASRAPQSQRIVQTAGFIETSAIRQ